MTNQVVLFGAGTVGRFIARELTQKGNRSVQFADNDSSKWGTQIGGIAVQSPEVCKRNFPEAVWVGTVLHTPYPAEIGEQIKSLGVKAEPLVNYLSVKRSPLDLEITRELSELCADEESLEELWDQFHFRMHGENHTQRPYRDISHLYFEDFISPCESEHFVDCGAADGDSISEFIKWQPSFCRITAFEPDPENRRKLTDLFGGVEKIAINPAAISDHYGIARFSATGDETAHIGPSGEVEVRLLKIDDVCRRNAPTFIKMDVEGSELEGLWGARQTIRKHQPVLAICAYHTDDHIWQIPLLIHALNPNYKLYLRRYLEQPWEMVWYAVPVERVK